MAGRLVLITLMLTAYFALGRAVDAQTDPAVPACEQAVAAEFYTVELFDQCLADYRDAAPDLPSR